MESIKAPSPTSLAFGTLVVIWTEVTRRRVSVWVGIKDSMEVMETRRKLVRAIKEKSGLPAGEPAPERTTSEEPRRTYERMRDFSGVRFE